MKKAPVTFVTGALGQPDLLLIQKLIALSYQGFQVFIYLKTFERKR
ncbi:hypothetical protein [Comamonas sp.]|nr:hypothetical protein [Comamonas sp.]